MHRSMPRWQTAYLTGTPANRTAHEASRPNAAFRLGTWIRVEALKKTTGASPAGCSAAGCRRYESTRRTWRRSPASARNHLARVMAPRSFGILTALHPAQPAQRGLLARVHPLHPVAQRFLRHPDVFHQPLESTGLNRGSLIAAPHRPIKGDVPLDQAGAHRHGHNRGDEAHLVARVPNRAGEGLSQSVDHLKIELFWLTGVGAGRVGEEQPVGSQNSHGLTDLLHRRHPGRENDGTAFPPHASQKAVIGEGSRGKLVAGDIKPGQEIDRGLIPDGGKPQDPVLPAGAIDLSVVRLPQLHPVTVFQVGDIAPRGLAHLVALIGRDAKLGRTLLQLHRVDSCVQGSVDQAPGDPQVPIVIDPDLGHDERGVPVSDNTIPDPNGSSHECLAAPAFPGGYRTAPSPPLDHLDFATRDRRPAGPWGERPPRRPRTLRSESTPGR